MTEAKAGDKDFGRLSEPFRRELLAYCYRMLGSVDEAEEVVQDVYLDAWRAYDAFEGRSSLRTWLYRIATRACFKALEKSRRRPLPADLGAPRQTWMRRSAHKLERCPGSSRYPTSCSPPHRPIRRRSWWNDRLCGSRWWERSSSCRRDSEPF